MVMLPRESVLQNVLEAAFLLERTLWSAKAWHCCWLDGNVAACDANTEPKGSFSSLNSGPWSRVPWLHNKIIKMLV